MYLLNLQTIRFKHLHGRIAYSNNFSRVLYLNVNLTSPDHYSASAAILASHWLSIEWINTRAHLPKGKGGEFESRSPAEEVSSRFIHFGGAATKTALLGNESWWPMLHHCPPCKAPLLGL